MCLSLAYLWLYQYTDFLSPHHSKKIFFKWHSTWQKLTLNFASGSTRMELLQVIPVFMSLFVSISLSMNSERNLYWKPWDFVAEGCCQGSSCNSHCEGQSWWVCGMSRVATLQHFRDPGSHDHLGCLQRCRFLGFVLELLQRIPGFVA